MGNPASKSSIQKNSSINKTVNFINSSGELDAKADDKSTLKDTDVLAKFTWNYGGFHVLLTGSFFKWKQTIPLEKQGDQFSITIVLTFSQSNCREVFTSMKFITRYKFIVDGEWRFSPEDPTIPDANGNINNYIDTTNFHPMIEKTKNKKEEQAMKQQLTDRQTTFQGVEQFAKNAPKLPPHYEFCSYLKSQKYNPSASFPNGGHDSSRIEDQNKKFEEELTQQEIMQLFNTPHCLPPPYHVEVDHIIRQVGKSYHSFCITQRFKNKYTTYRYFMMDNGV